jgi:hypothetical protein
MGFTDDRILDYDGDRVLLATKDPEKPVELEVGDFVRRVLQHVLPTGFPRIRNYGLFSPRSVPTKLARAGELLGAPPLDPDASARETPWEQLLLETTGKDVTKCKLCDRPLVTIAFRSAAHLAQLLRDRVPPRAGATAAGIDGRGRVPPRARAAALGLASS